MHLRNLRLTKLSINPSSSWSNPPSQALTLSSILPFHSTQQKIFISTTISERAMTIKMDMRTMEKAQMVTKARATRAIGTIGTLWTRSAAAASATRLTQMLSQRRHLKSVTWMMSKRLYRTRPARSGSWAALSAKKARKAASATRLPQMRS